MLEERRVQPAEVRSRAFARGCRAIEAAVADGRLAATLAVEEIAAMLEI